MSTSELAPAANTTLREPWWGIFPHPARTALATRPAFDYIQFLGEDGLEGP